VVVCLTGATGFVGRHILSELLKSADTVRVVVRRPGDLGALAAHPQLQVVTIDDLFGATSDKLAGILAGVDTLIHVAWYVDPRDYLHSVKNIDCLAGTVRLAHGFGEASGRRFVGIGTCLEYAASDQVLTADSPLRPDTLYASCKLAAYEATRHLLRARNVGFAWARLFYMHGQGESEQRLVPYIIRQLRSGRPVELTSGSQVRDFMDVVDVAREIVAVARSDVLGALNVCSGNPVTVRQVAERLADQVGRPDLLRFGARTEKVGERPFVVGRSWRD
jgi:dTDP-6-deoxy-L-talose 4-dehydrogenase (NAD+)